MSSSNASIGADRQKTWIGRLLDSYKQGLNEKKLNLDDDYIKFIRYGEYFIEKNGEGILAYISNNSFIDGVTHRQMRKELLETFDKIYILDLHGNSKKKETAPDGSRDENVFDIMQGVSINIFVKKRTSGNQKGTLADVFHINLFGERQYKYTYLAEHQIGSIPWQKLNYKEPYYFFIPKNYEIEEEYNNGFKLNVLFKVSGSGVKTDRDSLFFDIDRANIENRFKILTLTFCVETCRSPALK